MKLSWFAAIAVFGASALLSDQAFAQPLFDCADSIECTVANSDIDFRKLAEGK